MPRLQWQWFDFQSSNESKNPSICSNSVVYVQLYVYDVLDTYFITKIYKKHDGHQRRIIIASRSSLVTKNSRFCCRNRAKMVRTFSTLNHGKRLRTKTSCEHNIVAGGVDENSQSASVIVTNNVTPTQKI